MSTAPPLDAADLKKWKGHVDHLSTFEKEFLGKWQARNASLNALVTTVGADVTKLSLASEAIGEKVQPA